MIKKLFFTLIGIITSVFVTLLFLELLLNFFPVNEGLRTQPVNSEQPIYRFEANREAVYSKHWNFDIRNKVKINNYGFVNNQDYKQASNLPLLSVIGDSYVEALMVPFDKTLAGLLSTNSKNNRVYSFAASGAGLSQHLIWAEYAKKKFNSNFFIFVIISNDFFESISKYEASPGFHRFVLKENNEWELSLTNYTPSILRKIFRNSKLAMYLITNLKVQSLLNLQLNLGKGDSRVKYVSNFDADVSEAFWKEAKLVTDIYINNAEKFSGVKKENILFVIDGIRPQLYNMKNNLDISESFWYKIRNYFIMQASLKGFEVIDMQKEFIKDYMQNNKKFEFITDSHWNSVGHAAVTKSIIESDVWSKFLKSK